MKNRLSKIKFKINISLYVSLCIFVLYGVTSATTWVLVYLGISLGWVTEKKPFVLLTITLIVCIIIGTLFSSIASRKILNSMRLIMKAMNQLASGDFSARLSITHPPEYKLLSNNFNRMAEELAGMEVLRTDFINNFSHEFKTPIVSIKGFAEILKDDNLSREERDEYLDIVIEESTRLASLATNVLTLSKVEAQSILTNQQRYNVGEQLRQCILLLESKFEKKDILLNLDIHDFYIYGNKEMLNQVWLNLLDNAVKFISSNGVIDIMMKEKEGFIQITLIDNGCGIEEEALPKIFDKFYQADKSHATGGNGLGLSIVHKIITLHHGSIACDSILNQGTCFTIQLPIIE